MRDINSGWVGIGLIALGVFFSIFPQLAVDMTIAEARIASLILWVGGLILIYLPNDNRDDESKRT